MVPYMGFITYLFNIIFISLYYEHNVNFLYKFVFLKVSLVKL